MCVSIVFGLNMADTKLTAFIDRVRELGGVYEYGIGLGRESLLPDAAEAVSRLFADPDAIFEVHDLSEPHCACDIDDDIRNANKMDKKSKFFDFVGEVMGYEGAKSVSVLFFEEISPDTSSARRQMGNYDDFEELINRWNTWKVEGFEPTRRAYFIADDTPLLFTFTGNKFSQ